MDNLLQQIEKIVGPGACLTDAAEIEPYVNDWRGESHGATSIVVAPRSSGEVSEVVRACADAGVAIVPQGGNTSLCGGSIPDESGKQILLSMSRMNQIRNIDAANFSMEVEAGCILQNIQNAALGADRYFALSLGAEGSCQIGGNLSTNAGGVNVVRYGTARAQVLGLEAVLADGTIVSSLRSLRKDTAGYDLKQLFIGSEGTLGIITAATLKLFPLPGEINTALVTINSSGDAVRLLAMLRDRLGDRIEAFELVSDQVFKLVTERIPELALPFDESAPWYVLIDTSLNGNVELLETALSESIEGGCAIDAVIAKNASEAERFWRMRHSIAEAERAYGKALKHDISVPLSSMQDFLTRGDRLFEEMAPDARLLAFGHVGDGNLHYNVRLPEDFAEGEALSVAIYDLVAELGGSFSAEHGVGRVKRHYLTKYRNDGEIALMKRLKTALDPNNILNPGKVI